MKTYTITEADLDRLQEIYSANDDSWWYDARMDEWVQTLKEEEEIYYCECTETWENYICPCSVKN